VVLRAGHLDHPGEDIVWEPSAEGQEWLAKRLFQRLWGAGIVETRLLVRLTLLGNFIWDDNGRYLDGESFGTRGQAGPQFIDLLKLQNGTLSGDGRRGGDFRMWFWL